MSRLYYAAVQIEVENIDSGNVQDDKFSELIHVQRFLERNANCGFTRVFIFSAPAVSYDLESILTVDRNIWRKESVDNHKVMMPLTHQIDNDVSLNMKF